MPLTLSSFLTGNAKRDARATGCARLSTRYAASSTTEKDKDGRSQALELSSTDHEDTATSNFRRGLPGLMFSVCWQLRKQIVRPTYAIEPCFSSSLSMGLGQERWNGFVWRTSIGNGKP